MKQVLRVFFGLFLFWVGGAPAMAVTILFSGDFFADSTGTGIPEGAIVQLVVSTGDSIFSEPTASSFVGDSTDDLVLATATADNLSGVLNQGSASGLMPNRSFDAAFDSGDRLLLRWWPSLTDGATEPGENTAYGQYRPADDVSITSDSDHPFIVPLGEADGIILSMNVDFMGNLNNPGGDISFADLMFGTVPTSGGGGGGGGGGDGGGGDGGGGGGDGGGDGGGGGGIIPEPSRALLFLAGCIGVAFLRRRARVDLQ